MSDAEHDHDRESDTVRQGQVDTIRQGLHDHWTSPYEVSAVAQAFHEEYERQASQQGWETQQASRVPWHEVPDANRRTMLATVRALVDAGVISIQPPAAEPNPWLMRKLVDPKTMRR